MKKMLVIMVLVLMPIMAMAQTSGISAQTLSKMSDSERILVLDMIKKSNENSSSIPVPTSAEEVEKWSNIGNVIGKALSGTAKEMGVAVNEFSKTDVGFMVTVLVVWHFMGTMVVHIFGGILILLVGSIYIHKVSNNMRSYEWKKINGKDAKVYDKLSGDAATGLIISYGILILASIVTMFTF